jgi:polyferredoxin
VCPTGIDIRNGMQLECIACTQCIDACNGVMAKLDRAPNLIAYRSLVALERARPARIFRPRVVAYAAMLAALAGAFASALASRSLTALEVAHGAGQLYQHSADGRIANAYRLFIQNRDAVARDYRISLSAPPGFELLSGQNPVRVAAASELEARVFVLAPAGGPPERALSFRVEPQADGSHPAERSAVFLEPSAPQAASRGGDG